MAVSPSLAADALPLDHLGYTYRSNGSQTVENTLCTSQTIFNIHLPKHFFFFVDSLFGLVVKASASSAEDPGFDSHLSRGDFSGSSHTSNLKIGTPVATLPGAWRYRVRQLGLVGLVSVYRDWMR